MVFFFIKTVTLFIRVFLAGGQRCHSNTSLPIGLYGHQTAYDITSNALYLFGGMHPQEVFSQSIRKWDINTDTWTELSITTPTSNSRGWVVNHFWSYVNTAVTINDIVYFISTDDGWVNSDTVYRFRLSTLEWLSLTSITKPPQPAIKGCLTHNTTHILMVGGLTSASSDLYSDQLQIYRISSNTWSTDTINVSPIQGQGWVLGYCQSIGIDLYVFGGSTTESESDAIDNIFKYNPNDKWTSIGTLPQVQGYGAALYNEPSRAIYLVGGWVGDVNTYLDTVYVFDVDSESITDTWTMKHARSSMPAEIINNRLYVFGGEDKDTVANKIPLSSIEVCDIPRLLTMDPTAIPSVFPTRHPSVSPSNNPSEHPSKRPSTSPVHNPSVSPSQQPSAHPVSSSTSPPSHPTLRAEIPSLYELPKFTSTVDVTHGVSSVGSTYSMESAEDTTGASNLSMIMIVSSIVMVCLIVVTILLIKMIRKRHHADADAMHQLARMQSTAHDGKEVGSLPANVKQIEAPNGVSNDDETHANKVEKPGSVSVSVEVNSVNNMTILTQEEKEVRQWLNDTVQLSQYEHALLSNGYDSMLFIGDISNRKQLEDIGITVVGHQIRMMSKIKQLRNLQEDVAPIETAGGNVSDGYEDEIESGIDMMKTVEGPELHQTKGFEELQEIGDDEFIIE